MSACTVCFGSGVMYENGTQRACNCQGDGLPVKPVLSNEWPHGHNGERPRGK